MRLLNQSEEITYDRLVDVATGNDAKVFAKMRIADVVPLNGSGLSDDLFGFGLMAHFDFVVCDSDYHPLFAVEFDGPQHTLSSTQRLRDVKKNSICDHFAFPLLRINSRYVNEKYRGKDLLTYFSEVWFLAAAFDTAQADGYLPYDEPFDPNLIVYDGRDSRRFPYWLSLEEQLEIQQLQKSGRIWHSVPSYWIGADSEENYHCLAWLNVTKDAVVIAQTGMRHQRFPADISDILWQLSVFDIRRALTDFFDGKVRTLTHVEFQKLLRNYEANYELRSAGGQTRNENGNSQSH